MTMKIELNEQQEQALQQGRMVEIIDPAARHVYVLMAPERREAVPPPPVCEPKEDVSATGFPAPPSGPGDLSVPRVRLRDLPMPPEVIEEAKKWCKKNRRDRRNTEEELQLQYYFGGQAIYVVRTKDGSVVIPIVERYRGTEGLRYVLLTPKERSEACYTIPSRWNDDVSEILSS
jgi:hypothetical protein